MIAVLMLLPGSVLVWGFDEWIWDMFRNGPRDRIAFAESYTGWGAVGRFTFFFIVTLPYLLIWRATCQGQSERWRARGDVVLAPRIRKPLGILFATILVVTLYLFRQTSLEHAVRSNDVELARKRLEFNIAGLGPDNAIVGYISSGERFTEPVLPIAVENGNIEMVDLLLAYGAEINTEKTSSIGFSSNTLLYAIGRGDNRMVRHLLERGADPNKGIWEAASRDNIETVRLLVEAGADPSQGLGPAAERNDLEAVQFLLEAGADPSWGVRSATHTASVAVLDLLLRSGGDPSLGIVPAIRNYDDFLLEYLRTMGADPTCALMVERSLYPNLLARLLEEGADLEMARRKVEGLRELNEKQREAFFLVLGMWEDRPERAHD